MAKLRNKAKKSGKIISFNLNRSKVTKQICEEHVKTLLCIHNLMLLNSHVTAVKLNIYLAFILYINCLS